VTLLLGADETVHESAGEVGRRVVEETAQYWREWVRILAIPYEWQEAVIRATITLKLNAYDDTGAIIAAMTSSIPGAAGSGRNWDYRYCWLRDGYFVVNALNRLGAAERAIYWRDRFRRIHKTISQRAWSERRHAFISTFEGEAMDASLLLLAEVGFLDAADRRFAATVSAVEKDLRRGDFIFRYVEKDDFGEPANAFLVCTFWYVNALATLSRREEARELFEKLLVCRNRHGSLAEHIDPRSDEQWGNFAQTYSMVGLINAAIRLSIRWDQAF
jgi:GH15 family glucan-1,4-alpha-glucosidase